ncbi:COG3821 Predicted membrane protein [Caulobacteraceae bacterium]|jgi:uncharacterized membrane protein
MPPADIAALAFFTLCWLFYEQLLRMVSRESSLNTDMTVVRAAWMRQMARRESRFMDGQLLGHALNSASFFASSNLLLIAAAAGVLFGGERSFASLSSLELIQTSSRMLFELQLAVILIVLARGLLAFIWSIRQMNYCLTIFGATPEGEGINEADLNAFGDAGGEVLNQSLSAFNAGVRGYYFALAAAAWMFGPIAMAIATIGAVSLLVWRQRQSPSAKAIRKLRARIEKQGLD